MYRALLLFLISIVFCLPGEALAGGRHVVTAHYKVSGVCEKCKKRIEDASYIRGVKYAEWNKDNEELTLTYDSTKTSYVTILKNVAKAGHDTEFFKATDDDYDNLPSCCHYRSGVKKH